MLYFEIGRDISQAGFELPIVAEDDALEPLILLPSAPRFWHHRSALPCPGPKTTGVPVDGGQRTTLGSPFAFFLAKTVSLVSATEQLTPGHLAFYRGSLGSGD